VPQKKEVVGELLFRAPIVTSEQGPFATVEAGGWCRLTSLPHQIGQFPFNLQDIRASQPRSQLKKIK
jgi:hypothetical protein